MMQWTKKAEDELRRYWAEGLSAGEIHKRFDGGVSRNAIIGKAHRMGLERRESPIPTRRSYHNKSVSTVPLPKPRREAVPVLGKKMIDLAPHDCRWPLGDPRDEGFCFCAMPTQGHVYCENHRRISTSAHRKDIEHEE